MKLFSAHGYEGTPLSAIAKEVGIKTPSLYAHFESKEKLYFAVYEEVQAEHVRRLEALIESVREEDTGTKLYTILSETCRNYLLDEEKAAFLKRAMLFPPSSLQDELQQRFMEAEKRQTAVYRGIFEAAIEEGSIADRDADDLLAAYYCLLDGSFVQMFYYGPVQFQQRLRSVWSIFWEGITR
ncbi:TetR/AcrR family transcriptional regulator [Paenibacillus oceani]|uniref:TetR/AcrR family transcriptional regulator n=1 Tax=Paenibacillus oceani TaxID=2772510 RepID=A0A927C961_9BACL|nr:TetR/AcrR family transcriptional regulator [Paenibacillus oceani]MBD2863714.1 TetR/AcrR family transcriptional regulator [Paenibacillus oceani]